MRYSVTVPPTVEPVTWGEMQTHSRITEHVDQSYVESLIVAARKWVEQYTGRALITQTVEGYQDQWPVENYIRLTPCPVQSIGATDLKYYTLGGTATTFAATYYYIDNHFAPARVCLKYGASWPTDLRPENALYCKWVAGYGAAAAYVPEDLRHAIKLLVAHWYENRESVLTGSISKEFEFGIRDILKPYRVTCWV